MGFLKIRWKITELLGSKVLAETPCISRTHRFLNLTIPDMKIIIDVRRR
jgi:hypothetical protein